MEYVNNNTEQQRVSIPRSIASETAPTGPYRPGDGIYINDNTISVTGRQETLVSGVNIKTINGESLLGEGNIVISGGTGGTSYSAGTNIDITNDTISVTGITSYTGITSGDVVTALGYVPASGESGPSYSAGTNIDITDNTISVTGITSYTGVTEEEIASALGADPLTGITSSDVTTALGYTPLSAVPETYVTDTELQNALSGKQDTLISGTNIHTINGQDILGGGDMVITGGQAVVAGNNIDIEDGVVSVTGITSYTGITSGDVTTALGYTPISAVPDTYVTDTELQNAVSGKQDTLITGDNIQINNNTISVTGITSYTGITSGEVVTALGFTPASSGDLSNKQDTLVSGTNIKTINGESILGSGNIVISGGTGGTTYSAGTNIDITNDTISVTGITSYTGITKNDVTTALGFTPISSTTVTNIWSGTQAEYDLISPKVSTTLYLIHE